MLKIKTVIVIFVLLLLLVIFIPGYLKLQKLKTTNEGLTKRIEKLKIENTQLASEVKRLTQDPVYVEEVARKKMGVSKKGEVIYKITGDKETNE